MHISRTARKDDNVYRLSALDDRDVHDLQRILGKLRQTHAETAEQSSKPESNGEKAQRLLADRRRRAAVFGPTMFSEPAWDMLLILYLSGGRQTQSQLNEMSGASRSTGMRWLEYLSGRDLVRREAHPTDLRRNFVHLTDKGRGLLDLYLSDTE